MSDFKDYFFSRQSGDVLLPSLRKSISDMSTSIANKLSSVDVVGGQKFPIMQKDEFSNEISSLVHSEEFIEELSKSIGKPLPDETEDEFVERAKTSMRKLLSQKLST